MMHEQCVTCIGRVGEPVGASCGGGGPEPGAFFPIYLSIPRQLLCGNAYCRTCLPELRGLGLGLGLVPASPSSACSQTCSRPARSARDELPGHRVLYDLGARTYEWILARVKRGEASCRECFSAKLSSPPSPSSSCRIPPRLRCPQQTRYVQGGRGEALLMDGALGAGLRLELLGLVRARCSLGFGGEPKTESS